MSFNGYEAIPELVRRAGVEVVFGMVGGSNVPWLASGTQSGAFRFVRTRHEHTAINAGAGYARATNTVGVCTVTHGPGLANAVGSLMAARASRSPLILIVGEESPQPDPSQWLDQLALAKALGLGIHDVTDPGTLEERFWKTFEAARLSGSPQLLILGETLEADKISLSTGAHASPPAQTSPSPESIRAAIRELAGCKNPLVLAGQGAVISHCRDELVELADLTGALLGTTLRANRFFS